MALTFYYHNNTEKSCTVLRNDKTIGFLEWSFEPRIVLVDHTHYLTVSEMSKVMEQFEFIKTKKMRGGLKDE